MPLTTVWIVLGHVDNALEQHRHHAVHIGQGDMPMRWCVYAGMVLGAVWFVHDDGLCVVLFNAMAIWRTIVWTVVRNVCPI